MKIFISWSGELSHEIAVAVHTWLPLVIQSAKPYISSADTYKGTRWHDVVASELESSNYGIMCVTPENVSSKWLNYEAGALSKLETSRVSPLLIDISPSDVTGPLAQFQATRYQYGDALQLVKSVNSVTDQPLEEVRVERAFKSLWPDLKQSVDRAIEDSRRVAKPKDVKRGTDDLLGELLYLVRTQQKTLADLISSPSPSGSPIQELNALRDIDFTEVGYLLKNLRDIADSAAIPGQPETPAMVRVRAFVDLLLKRLSPMLDERHFQS
jgi:TIR domain